MNGYLAAAYLVTFGGVAFYAVRVIVQTKLLQRSKDDT